MLRFIVFFIIAVCLIGCDGGKPVHVPIPSPEGTLIA